MTERAELAQCPACWGKGALSSSKVVSEDSTTYLETLCDTCEGHGEVPAWMARMMLATLPGRA